MVAVVHTPIPMPALASPPSWVESLYNELVGFNYVYAVVEFWKIYLTEPIFYGILWLIPLAIIYLSSKNMTVCAVYSVIVGVVFAALLPGELMMMGGLIIFLGLVALFWKMLKG